MEEKNPAQHSAGQSGEPVPNPADNSGAPASQSTPSDTDLGALEQELNQTRKKLEEMTAISQRALADLQNYKRRVEEEKTSFTAFANAALFAELIPVIDNASRALEHENKDAEWAKGVEQTLQQLISTTEKLGLKPVPVDGPFDPAMHEALLTAPGPADQILEVLEKGYMLEGRVIKPARVKVGSGETAA